jgi:DNA-binding NarL/FixJ family response regulator
MVNGNKTRQEKGVEPGGLISYLAKLGLGDTDLTRVMSLLQAARGVETFPPEVRPDSAQPPHSGEPVPAAAAGDAQMETRGEEQAFGGAKPRSLVVVPAKPAVRLFLAEEQQILKEAYQSFFGSQPGIEIAGSTDDTSADSLVATAKTLKPSVILLGVKTVQRATVQKLETLREACPGAGLVLLFAFYDMQGIKALREFAKDSTTGCAYLLKHTIDTVEQLTQVILSVVAGRIIIDPMVMEGLIRSGDTQSAFLRELSPREMEVLSWMAKGFRNDTIADVLSRDVKTIERHINNIYNKLQNGQEEGPDDSRHPRVQATLTYLRATGLLPAEQPMGD